MLLEDEATEAPSYNLTIDIHWDRAMLMLQRLAMLDHGTVS